MFNISADALKWLVDHLRPRWFWALVAIFSVAFSVWSTIPDKYRTRIIDYVLQESGRTGQPADLRVADFEIEGNPDEFLVWLKAKVERNLVELYAKNGKRVAHRLSSAKSSAKADKVLAGSVGPATNDEAEINVRLSNAEGIVVASTSFTAPREFLKANYKVVPETLVYGLDVGMESLAPLQSKARPTRSLVAYAQFAQARRKASQQQLEDALKLLDAAVATDPQFASAHWAAGQILRRMGDEDRAKEREARANAINLDHPKIPILVGVSNPVPDAIAALAAAPWRKIMPGLETKLAEPSDYKLKLYAWRFDPKMFGIEVVQQLGKQGSTVSELRAHNGALLAINGGFFNIDAKQRLTPHGLLVADGRRVSPYHKGAGSGLLYEKNGAVGIAWSKDWASLGDGLKTAVQAGPMVVDPGGKNGIYVNDYNRHDRTCVCLTDSGSVTIVVVKGGLSLFELGEILATQAKDGGMGCERAINLDGGPSTQASFAPTDGKPLEIEGTWTAQNGVLIVPRN